MVIKLAGTTIAGGLALSGPAGLVVNGQQVTDAVGILQASSMQFFGRGNASTSLSFSAHEQYGSAKECEVARLTRFTDLPKSGIVEIVCGETGDTQSVWVEGCVLESVTTQNQIGKSVSYSFSLRGGLATTDVPDNPPTDAETETEVIMRTAKTAISSGASSGTITFASPLAGVPKAVVVSVSRPAGSALVGVAVDEDTVTANGFSYQLDAPVPDGTYKLNYSAVY